MVTELLAHCRALTVLATSREPLRLAPEHRFTVSPCGCRWYALPGEVERTAATTLFVERARHARCIRGGPLRTAAAITEICRRLDGLPLAIELGPRVLRCSTPRRLERAARSSVRGARAGPRDAPASAAAAAAATIEWSYRLLSPEEARAFEGFAVFTGGATIEAAQQVIGADLDTFNALVDKTCSIAAGGRSGKAVVHVRDRPRVRRRAA